MGAATEEAPPLCAAEAARATGASLIPGRESGYILPSVPTMAGGGGAAPAPNVTYKIDVHVPGLIGSKDDIMRGIYHGLRELERSGLRLGAGR